MFQEIKRFVGKHKFEYLITFFVFTNLFPSWFPQFMYYIAFALILYKMRKFPMRSCGKTTMFYVFIAFLWLSTTINMVLDLRLVLFSLVLYMAAPRLSIKWHLYKIKLLYCIFSGFGIATLANLYAKLAGINHTFQDEYTMYRVAEFSVSVTIRCGRVVQRLFLPCSLQVWLFVILSKAKCKDTFVSQ